MSFYDYKPYVPVAKRRAKAARQIDKLRKKGKKIHPIEIEKRKITQTFWGNAWCNHIESFSDYENRLPRGRTYVRNGSVCHLAVSKGCVEAIVSGSSLYNVHIEIKPLPHNKWENIKKHCTGKISSLLDLLSGKLTEGVMHMVCDHHDGLFPLPEDIKLSCDCPDWALMCKHVAAVLYGVGSRLDHSPEKLFELRGVDHSELIDVPSAVISATQDTKSQRRRIDHANIADVFDIHLSETPTPPPSKTSQPIKHHEVTKPKPLTQSPKYFSGASVRKKRKQLSLTQNEFAKRVGVSAATISNWENKGRSKLNLRENLEKALRALW